MSFIVPYNEESAYNSNSPDHDLLVEEQHYKAYDDDRDADPFTDDDLDSFQNVQHSSPSRYSDTGKLIPGTDTIIVNDLDYSVTRPFSNTVPTVHSTIKNFLLFRHMRQGDSKKIIQNCNLLIKPGTMTLIIGPPSSGKTTLCKLLADQLTYGKITKGSITLNGRPPRSKQYHRQVAYIQQQDHHIPTLTVRETLYFACRLQRPWPSYSRQECMDTVEEVMQTLGIDHRADTLVGDDILRGISGGEKKRVTIGLELVRPAQSLLVLDEPTTGLDATTSLSIFRCLRKQIDNAIAYSKALTNKSEEKGEEQDETPLGDDVITHGQDPEADSKTKKDNNKKKRIAKYKGGVPIVASLLQPGQDLVRLFDFIVVLTPGGKTAYYGPTRQFTEYFMHTFQTLNQWKSAHSKLNSPSSEINNEQEFNFSEFPVDRSPYDYVLDVVEQEGDLLAELYNQSPMCSFMKQQIQQELQRLGCAAPQPIAAAGLPTSPYPSPSSSSSHESSETDSPRSPSADKKKLLLAEDQLIIEEQKLSTYATPPWMQLFMLIMRGLQIYKNLPSPPISRIVVAVIVAAILGSLFWQLDDYQADARSKQGLTFFIACYAGFASLASIPVVFDQRPVYYLQLDRKYYHPIFYFISNVFITMPLTAVEGVAFGTVVYWMTGLNSGAGQFFYFLLIIVVMALTMNSLFQGAAYILPSLSMANIILPMILLSLSLFSGFTISKDRTPDWIEWIYWLSPFRYLMESLNINELYGQTFRCKNSELVPPKGTPGFYNATRICPLNTGEQFLQSLDNPTDENYKWYWLIVLLGMLAASMIFAMLAIVFVRYRPSAPRDFLHAEQSKTKRLLKRRKIQRRLAGLIKKGGGSPTDSGANPEGNSVPDMTLKMEDDLLLELDNLSDSSGSSSDKSDSLDRMDQYFTGHAKEVATKELIRKAWVSVRPTAKQLPRKMSAVLTFRDIEYTIRIPRKGLPPCIKKDMTIIRGISGMVKPGMLVALMGPSGAGKSTLLDVLANRKTGGNVEGDILINGLKRNNKIFPRYSGYIEQQNLLFASDTVLESVRFSAFTRLGDDSLPKDTGLSLDELRLMHVEWVLDVTQLNQQFLRHALVKELSYEQKKRLTVAVELAANPDLIFADEPTSGLDSLSASRLMHILRQISDSGRSIVCTIHQPSEELFNLFDHILLLSKKGRMLYFGPTGVGRGRLPGHSDATVVEFFETQGYSYRAGTNPADFVLDCCYPQQGVADPEVYYRESALWQNMKEEIDQHSVPPNTEGANKVKESSSLVKEGGPSDDSAVELYDVSQHEQQQQPIPYKKSYARNFFVQFQQLFYRSWNDWWRRPSSAISLLVRSVMFGIILGVMFSKLDQTQAGASERISLMYFGALFTTIGSMTYLNVLFDSRPVYYRETAAHSYRSLPYLASLFLTSMPWNFMSSIGLAIPIFFITGLRDSDWNYVVYFFAMMATMGFVSQLWAQMIGSLSPNAQVGNGLVSVCSILLSLGAGFLISSEQMPEYWVWIYWISYYHYCIEGLTANELSGLPFYCPDNEGAIPINVTQGGVTTVKFYCPITDGKQILDSVGYKDYIQVDISFMVGLLCVVFLIIWFALAKCRHITR